MLVTLYPISRSHLMLTVTLGMLTRLVSIFILDPGKGISQLLRIVTSNHPTIAIL